MQWPKVSVIIPSYNQGKYIERTLQSVINQRYPCLEIIVIDGGSTDDSVDIIKRYADDIAYWVSEPDGGQTKGLIKGFSHATGEILCWLNSDDLWEDDALREAVSYLQANPKIDAVFGNALWIDAEDNPIRAQKEIPFNRFVWMYTYNYIPGMSMFWRKSIYDKVGGLNPDFDLAMDADLWIRFADEGQIDHVNRIWSRMRYYPDQKNRRLREKSDAEDFIIRYRYWNQRRPPFLPFRKKFAQAIRIIWKLMTGCYAWNYKRIM